MKTQIFFNTQDYVKIVGTFVMPEESVRGAALLLHMMPATREGYEQLQQDLCDEGIITLAIDLRGHGDSIQQEDSKEPLDYTLFVDEDHQKSILDVEAAFQYLAQMTGITQDHLVIVGASIGANLALQFQGSHKQVAKSVLLSPGLDYRGIQAIPLLNKLSTENQEVYATTSRGDTYSLESVETFVKDFPEIVQGDIIEGKEHGTNMFTDTEFYSRIVTYISHAIP